MPSGILGSGSVNALDSSDNGPELLLPGNEGVDREVKSTVEAGATILLSKECGAGVMCGR